MRLLCDPRLVRGFVRRAKARYPKEFVELIYGREVRDGFRILALVEPEQEGKVKSVTWMEDEDAETLDDTPSSPVLLGTLHSHPKVSEASPSEFDWARQLRSGDRVAGICALWRGDDATSPLKSRVRFYRADALITVEKL